MHGRLILSSFRCSLSTQCQGHRSTRLLHASARRLARPGAGAAEGMVPDGDRYPPLQCPRP